MPSPAKKKQPSLKRLRQQLIGTWKLMSAKDRASPSDPWINGTFGIPPSGYFIYTESRASIQIMTVPPVKLQTPDTPTPAEALQIFNNYIAYYGKWDVDAQNIHHHVEGAWDPSQVGTDQVRPYELRGDKLIIGNQTTYVRVLKRLK